MSAEVAVKGLAKMKALKFLHITLGRCYYVENDMAEVHKVSNIVQFDKVSEYLPSSLQFMRWDGFPFSTLPNTFQGNNLVGLITDNSNIVQLWEDGEEKVELICCFS